MVSIRVTTAWPALLLVAKAFVMVNPALVAQSPPGGQSVTPSSREHAAAAPASAGATATVLQVMRGILFPNSNVVFSAQGDDPAAVTKAADPSAATDPLAGAYGGWEAVANSAVALSESARLLEVPRACSNGKPAPIQAAAWKKGLAQLREAGQAAYKAAQAKNQDQVVDAAEKITTACSTCHTVTAKRRRDVHPRLRTQRRQNTSDVRRCRGQAAGGFHRLEVVVTVTGWHQRPIRRHHAREQD